MTREPSLRASDADRDDTVTKLKDACAQGRLTLEELMSRLDGAFQSRTYGDLDSLTSDLPTRPVFTGSPRRWIVEVFAGGMYKGRWRVGPEVRLVSVFAGTALDLRDAVLTEPRLTVRVVALFAGPKVIVPDHTDVHLTGAALFGSHRLRMTTRPLEGAPQIIVRAYTLFGDVTVKDKPRRATRLLRRGERSLR